MENPALTAIEQICRNAEGRGISAVGASAALRAMAHHWKGHLGEGHSPMILATDIVDAIQELYTMRSEILRRVLSGEIPNNRKSSFLGTVESCRKCDSPLHGDYCSDVTCPYSDWPQHVPMDELTTLPAATLRERFGIRPRIRIAARATDGHGAFPVEFDAAPWFQQASDHEISTLRKQGWCGSGAETVVAHISRSHARLATMLDYCDQHHNDPKPIGFECSVDEDEALRWLKRERPALWAAFLCEDAKVTIWRHRRNPRPVGDRAGQVVTFAFVRPVYFEDEEAPAPRSEGYYWSSNSDQEGGPFSDKVWAMRDAINKLGLDIWAEDE